MRRYSEAVKADMRRRMSPPQRQSIAKISEELGVLRSFSRPVTARKDGAPAAVRAPIVSVAGVGSISVDGGLIQTTSG